MKVWSLPRRETRSVVLDAHVRVRDHWPSDSEWLRRFRENVARNIREREERAELPALLQRQAG